MVASEASLSPLQCVEAASADRDKRVCDLKPLPGAQTIILLLSCITVSRRVVLDRCAGLTRMARLAEQRG